MKDNDVDILRLLAEDKSGMPVKDMMRLPGAGSGRIYYRIVCGEDREEFSCIGVVGENERDCRAFVALSKAFCESGLSVPEVMASSQDGLHYIQEDLGNVSLFDMIKNPKMSISDGLLDTLVRSCLSGLVEMQCVNPEMWEDAVEYADWGERQVRWDLNYFKYEYLKTTGVDFDEELLEDDFEKFSADIIKLGKLTDGFMYRDFQSRNIMIRKGEPFFIDFQGGRRGPGIYDAISFLWQARAGFCESFRRIMLDFYFERREAKTGIHFDADVKQRMTDMFALFRTLQVLGAYGLRGLVEHKAHFIESIPGALSNLKTLADAGVICEYPELEKVCRVICGDTRFETSETGGLTVEVFSFSYKKGYPADFSGNGGGFMFDCRGMHNPGRYEEYKHLTGRDAPVKDFLEERGEVQKFVDNAVEMVSPSIETYLRRGFTNLQIGFGCTGGQHRSVYCAEQTARILKEKYPEANIVLIHREHP